MPSHTARDFSRTSRPWTVGILCAVLAAGATAAEPPDAPPASAPAPGEGAKPADSSDILRGPQVAERDLQDPERFTGRERAGKAPVSKPAMELRALQAALDELSLSGEKKARVNELRASFLARLDAYDAEARNEKKKLADERAKAPANQPPSADYQKRMQALESRRPKIAELRAELEKTLSQGELEQLKQRFADTMKKYRDEAARRDEAERKRKAEALQREKQAKPAAPTKDAAPPMQEGEGMQGSEEPTDAGNGKEGDGMRPADPDGAASPQSTER